MNTFNQFFFGIFPYIALSIFFFGSLFRFDREQYSWKSDSSQLLYRGQLRLGNILFHVGILMVFFGHLFGLLTPVWFWDAIGISHSAKQMIAIVLGGVFGLMAMAGLLILLNRRLKSDRLAANATWRDKLVLIWLIATLALGLLTIFVSLGHRDGLGKREPGQRNHGCERRGTDDFPVTHEFASFIDGHVRYRFLMRCEADTTLVRRIP